MTSIVGGTTGSVVRFSAPALQLTGFRQPVTSLQILVTYIGGVAKSIRGVAVWIGVIAAALLLAPTVLDGLPEAATETANAFPLTGRWEWHGSWTLLTVACIGALMCWQGPRYFDALNRNLLAVSTGALSAVWTFLIALSDGIDQVSSPLNTRWEYLPLARTIDGSEFLQTFLAEAASYPTHVKGHPPGATLVFWLWHTLGFESPLSAALFVLGCWGAGIAAVIATLLTLNQESTARTVAPFLVLFPGVVWAGASADALFFGVLAMAVLFWTLATHRTGWVSALWAASAGLTLSIATNLTYGAMAAAPIFVMILLQRPKLRPLIISALGFLVPMALQWSAGHFWLDGFHLTRGFYAEGLAARRPYAYFATVGNLACLFGALGPVVVTGCVSYLSEQVQTARAEGIKALLNSRYALVTGVLISLAAANFSGMSKGEVERIWLLFSPWAVIGATWAITSTTRRQWLGAQLIVTLALQAALVSPW